MRKNEAELVGATNQMHLGLRQIRTLNETDPDLAALSYPHLLGIRLAIDEMLSDVDHEVFPFIAFPNQDR